MKVCDYLVIINPAGVAPDERNRLLGHTHTPEQSSTHIDKIGDILRCYVSKTGTSLVLGKVTVTVQNL